jgi:hypothetical protein
MPILAADGVTLRGLGFGAAVRASLAVNVLLVWHLGIRRAVLMQPGECRVANDCQQPRAGVISPESIECAQGPQKRILNDVVRIVVVANQPTGQVVGRVQVLQRQCLETSLLALIGEIFVGARLLRAHAEATIVAITLLGRARCRRVLAESDRAHAKPPPLCAGSRQIPTRVAIYSRRLRISVIGNEFEYREAFDPRFACQPR